MSWPRKSLFLVLFFLSSPWGNADTITVNTTTDDNADNSLCSLREAVEYFNRNKPSDGYQGCKAPLSDELMVVQLPADEDPYVISAGSIPVRAGIAINGTGIKGEDRTVVEVQGAHRAFLVAFNPSFFAPECSPCAPVSDPARPTLAPAPALEPESDTEDDEGDSDLTNDGANDYLTFITTPELTGSIDPPAGGHKSDESYVVRIYQTLESGHELLDSDKLTPASTELNVALPWTIRVGKTLAPGLHYLTYTVERVKTVQGTVVQAESEHSLELKLAVYSRDDRLKVTLSNLVLKGGKSACVAATVTCAADENGTYLINGTGAASYDKYSLTYENLVEHTAGNGGVIFSSEDLALTDVILQDGEAKDVLPDSETTGKGGGIYLSADAISAELNRVELRDNKAESGAAIFMASNALTLTQSLITGNEFIGSSGTRSIVELGSATSASTPHTSIQNSTFSGNTGVALSLRDNTDANTDPTVLVENVTVVDNTGGGIDFNNSDVTVKNSIVAGNQNPAAAAGTYLDCIDTTTAIVSYTLIVRNGSNTTCPAPTVANGNVAISDTGDETFMTGPLDAQGRCHGLTGILCPLADRGGATFVHMPRLLPTYTSVSQSPLINKAGPDCLQADQRGKSRNPVACDMGAVEAQSVPKGEPVKTGDVVKHGGRYEQYLGENLEDEELLPGGLLSAGLGGQCLEGEDIGGAIYPPSEWADSSTSFARARIVANSYNPNEPGCPWREVEPPRGRITYMHVDPLTGTDVAGQGYIRYTPNYFFHGFDTFEFRVVTTLSKLNPLREDRSRLVTTKVVVEPGTDMTSDKLGGALDGWGVLLLGILGLGWRSRRQI